MQYLFNTKHRKFLRYENLLLAVVLLLVQVSRAQLPDCPTTCRGNCVCPSLSAPTSLPLFETPQFIVLYTDEIVTETMFRRLVTMTSEKRNRNGCEIPFTWYVRSTQSDPDIIRNAYNRYYEVAVSAATEAGDTAEQIKLAQTWLQDEARVPVEAIRGFRSPPWSNSIPARAVLVAHNFTYDNSIVEPANQRSLSTSIEERLWPYSMDNGVVQDCASAFARCDKREKHHGLMEIPEWLMEDEHGEQVYDIFSRPNWKDILQSNFDAAYNGNRAPFAVPLSSRFLLSSATNIAAFSAFIAETLEKENVWFVTNTQLVEWMRSPLPSRMLHNSLRCDSKSRGDQTCYPPRGGCENGIYDYSDCTCHCSHRTQSSIQGFCRDDDGRCTIAQSFNEDFGAYFCEGDTQNDEDNDDEKVGLFGSLNPGSTIAIALFAMFGALALFGLYKGLALGIQRARVLDGKPGTLQKRRKHRGDISGYDEELL